MTVPAFRPEPTGPACHVCNGGALLPVRREPDGHAILECSRCGVWSVDPLPDLDGLRTLYDDAYYAPWRGEAEGRRRMWRRRLRLLRGDRRGRLLDVGCAEGSFLEEARRVGFDVEGTELSTPGARRTAARLDVPVHCGELREADLPAGRFSVVTLWHVLEHVLRPGETLAEARRILEPRGLLVVAVPNRCNTAFRAAYRVARGRAPHLYRQDDREQHLHHWGPPSLRRVLELHGFEVMDLRPDPCALGPVKRFVDGIGHVHSWIAREPRTNAMVALAAPAGGAS